MVLDSSVLWLEMMTWSFQKGIVCRRTLAIASGIAAGFVFFLAVSGCWRRDSLPADDPSRLTISLRSPAFSEGGMIPKEYTCDGPDRSPPLEWSGVPDSARSLALICDDPDAPMGTWSHWVVFDLPPQVKALEEGIPAEPTGAVALNQGTEPAVAGNGVGRLALGPDPPKARQGQNDFGKIGYGGPCPPSGTHRYFFRLYALDAQLGLSSSATRSDVLKAIQGHIVAEGRLIGKYARAK
jgi:Raf kinase inhibitor-like YbhB/YbcL family protein